MPFAGYPHKLLGSDDYLVRRTCPWEGSNQTLKGWGPNKSKPHEASDWDAQTGPATARPGSARSPGRPRPRKLALPNVTPTPWLPCEFPFGACP